jgi:outer membrane immunogenic protein
MPVKSKAILAFAASAGIVGSASAADIYQPPPPIATPIYTPSPAFSWTGPYLGIQGGYDWNNATTVQGPYTYPAQLTGGIVGLYGGYNWQTSSNWVFGIDGSINYDGAKGSSTTGGPLPDANSASVNWKGFVRGRVGYAWDRVLVYGTLGGAVAGYKATTTGPDGAGSATPWGWTVGGGIEMAFTNNIVGRLDYAYQDYGTFTVNGTGTFSGGVPVKLRSHSLMAGVAFKF